jgi:hypothetical protein
MDIEAWKKFPWADKTWKNFKSHFTRKINDNKSDTSTLKAIGMTNAVKEQVDQNKENQRVLAQATVEANDKIELLVKQQAQLYAALMAKQPQQQVSPLQETGVFEMDVGFFITCAIPRDKEYLLGFNLLLSPVDLIE